MKSVRCDERPVLTARRVEFPLGLSRSIVPIRTILVEVTAARSNHNDRRVSTDVLLRLRRPVALASTPLLTFERGISNYNDDVGRTLMMLLLESPVDPIE